MSISNFTPFECFEGYRNSTAKAKPKSAMVAASNSTTKASKGTESKGMAGSNKALTEKSDGIETSGMKPSW